MKKTFISMAASLMLSMTLMAQRMTDADAIKAVIDRETTAYFNVDYDNWKDSWSHVPYAYWSFADQAGINYFEGWRAIETGFADYFVTNKPLAIEVERVWEDLRIYKDGAYARFKQTVITNGVRGSEQREIRVLEKDKKNKVWKIILVGALKQ
jgi:hypothetical protein